MRSRQHSYRERLLGALVAVLALALALVRGWPAATEEAPSAFRDRPAERIQVRDVQPTSQSQEQTPPPPAPLPPVVVPDEVVVTEELDFGEAELQVDVPDPEDDARLREGAEQATAAQTPDTGARLLRNVQPTYPSSAREDDVRARIEVEVEIDPQGRVQSASIQQRWRLRPNGSPEAVEELKYGLEEAALGAARRSLFRPARHRGKPVTTRTVLTFTFGPE
jgi:TonB family protein